MTPPAPIPAAPGTPRVAVVLVNWRAAAMTLEAARRVLDQTLPPIHVYVVDNGSGDGSAAVLRAALPALGPGVTLLESPRNGGFGAGNNAALARILTAAKTDAGADHVWLLNNDAIPAPDCLAHLVAAAAAAPVPVGIVGSLLVDPVGATPPHFGSWLDPITLSCGAVSPADPIERHKLGWMTAASMLVSVPALAAAGLFDEGFFMYWEDADLNRRVAAAGFVIVGARDAVVEHHAGTSSAAIPVQRYLWHFASQDRFLAKHHPMPHAARAALRVRFLLKAAIDRDWPRLRGLARAVAASARGGAAPA